jgi:hypothetical protein
MPTQLPEILTREEMQQRYKDEWLLIAYTETDENLNVLRGEVLAHAPTADSIYKLLPQYPDRSVALEYIGEIPSDFALML